MRPIWSHSRALLNEPGNAGDTVLLAVSWVCLPPWRRGWPSSSWPPPIPPTNYLVPSPLKTRNRRRGKNGPAAAPPEAAKDAEAPPEAAERYYSFPRGCYAAARLSSEEQEGFLHPTRPGGHPRAVQASCSTGSTQVYNLIDVLRCGNNFGPFKH